MADTPQYGGQAVIEGVMMRGPKYYAVACRRANKEIVIEQESVETILRKFQWLNKPFLRGTLALIDAMALGMKALMFSANLAMEDVEKAEAEKPKKEKTGRKAKPAKTKPEGGQKINDIAVWGTMILALGIAIAIFFVLPQILAGLLQKRIQSDVLLNVIDGLIRFAFFIAYIVGISYMKDIRRVFQYHGAEHRVINTFEAGLDLTPDNIAEFGTVHQRCGTSFLLIVMVIAILVHMFLPFQNHAWYLRVPVRLAFLPVIAGLAYETIRFAGKHRGSRVMNALLSPGLLLQRVTTQPPTEDMIEVAVAALQAVLAKENEPPVEPAPELT